MGTGLGAVREGKSALQLLKKLLLAGFPPEHALRSLNSLCALRGMAGAATVDMAELQLDTGKVLLYKWGAAPSYLLRDGGIEKIGTAGPPPGLSVTEGREKVERLSLRRGEVLVLLSDGVGGEDALQSRFSGEDLPLGELAARILDMADTQSEDDATVAVIRLNSESPGVS
jgi:stage II sporulation protein E